MRRSAEPGERPEHPGPMTGAFSPYCVAEGDDATRPNSAAREAQRLALRFWLVVALAQGEKPAAPDPGLGQHPPGADYLETARRPMMFCAGRVMAPPPSASRRAARRRCSAGSRTAKAKSDARARGSPAVPRSSALAIAVQVRRRAPRREQPHFERPALVPHDAQQERHGQLVAGLLDQPLRCVLVRTAAPATLPVARRAP
jgi:hypothetical protein